MAAGQPHDGDTRPDPCSFCFCCIILLFREADRSRASPFQSHDRNETCSIAPRIVQKLVIIFAHFACAPRDFDDRAVGGMSVLKSLGDQGQRRHTRYKRHIKQLKSDRADLPPEEASGIVSRLAAFRYFLTERPHHAPTLIHGWSGLSHQREHPFFVGIRLTGILPGVGRF